MKRNLVRLKNLKIFSMACRRNQLLALICLCVTCATFRYVFNSVFHEVSRRTVNARIRKETVTEPIVRHFSSGTGFLNMYGWEGTDFCLKTTSNIYWHPLFPNYPSTGEIIKFIDDNYWMENFVFRRFLFKLFPNETGPHIFQFATRGPFDFFLTEYSKNGELLSKHEFRCSDRDMERPFEAINSKPMALRAGVIYNVDLIYLHPPAAKFTLSWKRPNCSNFSVLSGNFISPVHPAKTGNRIMPKPAVTLDSRKHQDVMSDPRLNFDTLKSVQLSDLTTKVQKCNYHPSYLKHSGGKSALYSAIWKIYSTEARYFPFHHASSEGLEKYELSKSKAQEIANSVVKLFSSEFTLDQIVFVGANAEANRGTRYFVEVDLVHRQNGTKLRLSDYFYHRNASLPVCFPKYHQWKKNVDIYVVFTSSGYHKKWLLLMIDSIKDILESTQDKRVHLIIADFNTRGIDINYELERRNVSHKVIKMPGKFNKVKGLNRAAKEIPSDDSIIFTFDLHLIIPRFIFDQARKNTVYGKIIYGPILWRLKCGEHPEYTEHSPPHWVFNGFGILSMYKRDWDIIGGMNEELFGGKWGGEDWEILDRIYDNKYEVVRQRLPGFYHIHHSRDKSDWYTK